MLRVRELNPCRRVITGLFPAANVAVDGCRFEAPRYDGTEQEMVDAQPRVAAASIPEIIPECIDALVRMERSQRIGPALSDEASIGVPDFRAKQGVIYPSLRLVDVELGGYDIVPSTCTSMGCCKIDQSRRSLNVAEGRSSPRVEIKIISNANSGIQKLRGG